MRNVNFSSYSTNISNIRNYIDSKLGNKLVSSGNTLKPNDEYTTRHNVGMDSAYYKVLQSPTQTNMCRSNTPFNTTKVTPFIREERRYQNSLLEKPIIASNRINSDTYSVVKGNTPNFKYSHLDHSNFLNEKTLNIPSKHSNSKYYISEYYNGTINSGNSYSKFGKEPSYGISTCRKRTLECMSNTDMKSATLNDESEEFYDAISDNEYGDNDKITSKINIQPPIKKPLHVLTPSTAYSSGQLGTKQNTLKGRSTTYGIPLSLVESDDAFFLESKNPERSLQSDISTPVSYINEVKYSHPDIISRSSILPPSALATGSINQRLRTPLRYRNTQILNKSGTCSRILTAAEMKQVFCRVRRPVGILRDFTPIIPDKSYADNKTGEVNDSKITNSNYDKINAELLENSTISEKSVIKNKHPINATIETKSDSADSDLITSSKLGDSENLSQIKNIFGKFINNKEHDKTLSELDNSSKEYRTDFNELNVKDNDKKFGLDTDKYPAKNANVIDSKSCEISEEASKDINKEINKDTNSEINKGINKDIGKETTKENDKEINREVSEISKVNKEDNEEAIKEVNKDIVPWWLANADKPNMVAIEEDSVFAPDSDSSDNMKNKDINDESKLPLPSLFKDNSSKSLQVNNIENTGQSEEVNTLHRVFENNSSGLESITKPSNSSIFCIGGTESSLQSGETKQLNANFIHQPSSSASIFSVNNGNSGNFANLPEVPKTIDLQSNSKNILTETQTNIFKNNLCTVSSKDSSASNLLNNNNLFSFSNTLNNSSTKGSNSNELGQLIPNSSQSKDLDNSILSKPVSLFGVTTQGITNTSDSLFSQLTKSPEKSGNLLSDAVSPQKDNSVTLFSSTQPSPFKSVSEFKDSNVTSNSSGSAKNLVFGDTFTKKPELNSTGSIFGTTSPSSFIPFSSTTLNPVPSVGTNPSGSIFGSTSTTSQSSTVAPLSASGGLFGAQPTSGSATSLIANNSGNNGNSLTSTDNKTSGLFGPFSNNSFSSTNIGTSNTYLFGQNGASSPFGTSPIQNPPAANIFGSATQNISSGTLGPNPILTSNSNNPFIGHTSNSNSATSHRRRIARAKRSQ
ncbi:hypothetical protein cand_005740 [Cryptosporidium andersoni]|uniref:Uncharacterized protein n=1 Tax=Cryptosporidium andersoni TaxID=117008 RepID=A0A1J4MPR6_9CRYT|nr:hypothetical protein cand_005740 [Cryptosporidium andersoni]